MSDRHTRGFTLVEVLIVVVILGVLAAMVVPQFASATGESRDNSIRMNLHRVRTQLQVYKTQHDGQLPTLAAFEQQMTLASDADGTTAAIGTAGYPFGPYLVQVPLNPKTNTRTVSADAIGSSAWYYDESTGEFRANDSVESSLY